MVVQFSWRGQAECQPSLSQGTLLTRLCMVDRNDRLIKRLEQCSNRTCSNPGTGNPVQVENAYPLNFSVLH